VRYVGDPVAAVAATDRHIAEDALKLIDVKYEKIPHVLDANEALKPDAPKIAPNGNLSVGKGSASAPIEESWGDVAKGFSEADRVFEDTYISKHVNNAQMERRVSIAKWDAGKLTVFASTQGVSNARTGHRQGFRLAAEQGAESSASTWAAASAIKIRRKTTTIWPLYWPRLPGNP
jgi:CO/xanthine dehydrogenase Mo-binding subunit